MPEAGFLRRDSFLKIVSSIILMSSYWFVYIRVYRSKKYDIVNYKSFFVFLNLKWLNFLSNIYKHHIFIL